MVVRRKFWTWCQGLYKTIWKTLHWSPGPCGFASPWHLSSRKTTFPIFLPLKEEEVWLWTKHVMKGYQLSWSQWFLRVLPTLILPPQLSWDIAHWYVLWILFPLAQLLLLCPDVILIQAIYIARVLVEAKTHRIYIKHPQEDTFLEKLNPSKHTRMVNWFINSFTYLKMNTYGFWVLVSCHQPCPRTLPSLKIGH